MSRFAFVQFELPGTTGIDDGRYPVRTFGADKPQAVLIVRSFGASPPPRRRIRRPRPKPAKHNEERVVPVTELTVVEAVQLDGDGVAWLTALRDDEERRDELVAEAIVRATGAIASRRVAAADASLADPALESALASRIGFGDGERLVDGDWEEAIELPNEQPRQSRAAALRPQERFAALMSGRERPLACEELLLRGRTDVNAGRDREAALQLRVALEALLAETPALQQEGQEEDLAYLEEMRPATGDGANEALCGPLTPERAAEVAETLAVCERVLRRRTAFS